MRRAGFTINSKPVSGHWSMNKYNVGEFYESALSGKLFVVTTVFDGEFETSDGIGFFYQMREASESESNEYRKPYNDDEEKKMFDDFFDSLNN